MPHSIARTLVCWISILATGSQADELDLAQRVRTAQQTLIKDGICLSNTALITREGKTIYRGTVQSDHPVDQAIKEDTLFPIWSMSKPITCVAAMILQERGVFALNDPVSKAIPLLAQCRVQDKTDTVPLKRPITFRHLFHHTAGFDGYDGSFHEEGTWKVIMEMDTLEQVVELLVKQPLKHQPGERHTYGMNHAILGYALERLAKKPFAQILKEEIFGPLGMTDTRFDLTTEDRQRFQPLMVKEKGQFRHGTPAEDELYYKPGSRLALGGEGLISTMSDYARFCQMLVDQGSPLLKPTTLRLMLEDCITDTPGHGAAKQGYAHGLGFYVLKDTTKEGLGNPSGMFGWGGYHTTHFWIDPKNKLYGLFMTRRYPSEETPLRRLRQAVYSSFPRLE